MGIHPDFIEFMFSKSLYLRFVYKAREFLCCFFLFSALSHWPLLAVIRLDTPLSMQQRVRIRAKRECQRSEKSATIPVREDTVFSGLKLRRTV